MSTTQQRHRRRQRHRLRGALQQLIRQRQRHRHRRHHHHQHDHDHQCQVKANACGTEEIPMMSSLIPASVPECLSEFQPTYGEIKAMSKQNIIIFNTISLNEKCLLLRTKQSPSPAYPVASRRVVPCCCRRKKKCVGGGGFPQFLLSCNLFDSYNDSTLHI